MTQALPEVFLARHGETAWTITGQHTGRSDIALTAIGEQNASRLGMRLKHESFALVLSSPLVRARRTCELAGFGASAVIDPDLAEWDYGAYEGKTSAQIREERPDWNLFQDGCPGGESIDDVGKRADNVIAKVRSIEGNALIFSHGHLLRTIAARWLGLPPTAAAFFVLGTASLSRLGYEHNLNEPAIRLWNDNHHLRHA